MLMFSGAFGTKHARNQNSDAVCLAECYRAKPHMLCYIHIMICVLLHVLFCMTDVRPIV